MKSAKEWISSDALLRYLRWVDEPASVGLAIRGLIILCVLLFLGDFVIHRHSYFSIESWPGFYALAGFVAFTVIVLGAKALRKLILRPETYYGDRAVDAEPFLQAVESDSDAASSEAEES